MLMQPIATICYDLTTVSRFFRSVALSVSFQQHTQVEWVSYRDSRALNAVYSLLCWKTPPGNVEIIQASRDRIQETADNLYEHYLNVWLRKMFEEGPAAGSAYVTGMEKIRDFARKSLAELFQESNEINAMVSNQLKQSITYLSNVKLAATVGVAVIGTVGSLGLAPGGAMIYGGVSLGYSSTCSMIKTWEQGAYASVAGISIEVSKAGTSEVLGGLAGASQVRAFAKQSRAEQIIRSAEGQIRKASERLAKDGLRRAQKTKALSLLNSSTAQVAAQKKLLGSAGSAAKWAGAAKVGVPVVFAAWDIWEGISDYNDTMNSLK